MAKYQEFKRKSFDLQKDARAWAVKIKKQNKGGATMKIETNYVQATSKWDAVVLMKME